MGRRGLRRRTGAVTGTVVIALLGTACANTVGGNAHTTFVPDAQVPIIGTDHSQGDRLAGNAISDIQAFWTEQMPKAFDGKKYQPVSGGFYSIDPAEHGQSLPCGATARDIGGNAFYCPSGDLVAWDRRQLLPTLVADYGTYTVALVLSHEWGHAIQKRAVARSERTIVRETQADCFAGAFTRWATDGHAPHFHPSSEDLDKALAGFLQLADPVGTNQTTVGAHGNAFDRVSALQSGYDQGTSYCADPLNFGETRRFTELPFTGEDAASQGNLPLGDAISKGKTDLDDYWKKIFPIKFHKEWKPPAKVNVYDEGNEPTCDGKTVDATISYCVNDNSINLQQSPGMASLYNATGDYAVISLLGTAYAMAARHQLGKSTDDKNALLGSVCLDGVYTAQLFTITSDATNRVPQAKWPRVSAVLLSSGDLDEAIQAQLIAVNESAFAGPEGTNGFDRVNVFQQGVRQGFTPCNGY